MQEQCFSQTVNIEVADRFQTGLNDDISGHTTFIVINFWKN